MRVRSCSGIPGPVSATLTLNWPLTAPAVTRTSPASVNLMALPTRLSSTCVRRCSSPRPTGKDLATSVFSASFLLWASDSVTDRTVSTTLSMHVVSGEEKSRGRPFPRIGGPSPGAVEDRLPVPWAPHKPLWVCAGFYLPVRHSAASRGASWVWARVAILPFFLRGAFSFNVQRRLALPRRYAPSLFCRHIFEWPHQSPRGYTSAGLMGFSIRPSALGSAAHP